MIDRLQAAHGPLMFFQSGGCCDGSSPMCLPEGELPLGAHDLLLGEIGGAPFYIDAEQYERWGRPTLRHRRRARRGRRASRSRAARACTSSPARSAVGRQAPPGR